MPDAITADNGNDNHTGDIIDWKEGTLMLKGILHVGLTVTDLDRSVAFYRDMLGLAYLGEMEMEGPETEQLFQQKGCKARVAYLNGSRELAAPPVELIQFVGQYPDRQAGDLFRTSISELCFAVEDIDREYRRLQEMGVEFLSEPQTFDSTEYGFGKSRAVYLRDPDGIILELLQTL